MCLMLTEPNVFIIIRFSFVRYSTSFDRIFILKHIPDTHKLDLAKHLRYCSLNIPTMMRLLVVTLASVMSDAAIMRTVVDGDGTTHLSKGTPPTKAANALSMMRSKQMGRIVSNGDAPKAMKSQLPVDHNDVGNEVDPNPDVAVAGDDRSEDFAAEEDEVRMLLHEDHEEDEEDMGKLGWLIYEELGLIGADGNVMEGMEDEVEKGLGINREPFDEDAAKGPDPNEGELEEHDDEAVQSVIPRNDSSLFESGSARALLVDRTNNSKKKFIGVIAGVIIAKVAVLAIRVGAPLIQQKTEKCTSLRRRRCNGSRHRRRRNCRFDVCAKHRRRRA